MNKFDELMNLLKNKTNFSFVRFNDGEMMGIKKIGALVARKTQKVDISLHNKLILAINHTQRNYWKGMPCSICFPQHRLLFDQFVRFNYKYLTHATVFTNSGNWEKFIELFTLYCDKRDTIWISGRDQNLVKLPCNLNIKEHIKLPLYNCWDSYDEIKNMEFRKNDLVILSCGPMSRVLAHEWFSKNPECTFLDLGSVFDPYTRNVWHAYHRGTLKYCQECNKELIK